ncbi:MAG: YlbE family protein [Actinomycetes bacterium]
MTPSQDVTPAPRTGAGSPSPVSLHGLLTHEPVVVTAGAELFAATLRAQAVRTEAVDWSPPMGEVTALDRVMADPRREGANQSAVARMLAAGAELVDVRPAREALGLAPDQFLHAGPPLAWERASGPMRGALIGAAVFEGLATTPEQAEAALAQGQISLDSCHHHGAVGPMAGVISPSMWMFELSDPVHGGRAFCSLNEGLGKVLRYGAYGPDVLARLRWMTDVLGPLLASAVRRHGPVDVKTILAAMLAMGDEGHNRNRAGTMMLLRELLGELIESPAPTADVAAAVRFVAANDHFFLNLSMPACKLATDAARDIPGSTVVVAMARNGTDFGIQVSGTGDQWFSGPAAVPDGLYLGGYGPSDANPDIGDSAITETAGIGGFAMASAPAIVRLVGGSVSDAIGATERMYEITVTENPAYQIPVLDFRGTPTGIDVTRVVRSRILPQINTGIAGKVAGTGQVGAGLVNPPAECFTAALDALAAAAPTWVEE